MNNEPRTHPQKNNNNDVSRLDAYVLHNTVGVSTFFMPLLYNMLHGVDSSMVPYNNIMMYSYD